MNSLARRAAGRSFAGRMPRWPMVRRSWSEFLDSARDAERIPWAANRARTWTPPDPRPVGQELLTERPAAAMRSFRGRRRVTTRATNAFPTPSMKLAFDPPSSRIV